VRGLLQSEVGVVLELSVQKAQEFLSSNRFLTVIFRTRLQGIR
jgi:hypothetical protein